MLEGLRADQIARANSLCAAYNAALRSAGSTLRTRTERDVARARKIAVTAILRPALEAYTKGALPLPALREAFDTGLYSRRLWGVTGLRVRIALHHLAQHRTRDRDRDRILRWTLALPGNDAAMSARMHRLCPLLSYAGENDGDNANTPATPPTEAAWLLLSFCWHVFEPAHWPIFQASTLAALAKAGLWQATAEGALDYPGFRHTMAALHTVCRRQLPGSVPDYLVEHVLAAPPARIDDGADSQAAMGVTARSAAPPGVPGLAGTDLSLGFVPPIIGLAESLAAGRADAGRLAYACDASADRAFEIVVHAAFTIMGYDSVLLGRGAGRAPDGYALCRAHNYAVIWDAKIRTAPYRMGTDDRAIREYVAARAEQFRAEGLHTLYYAIVSSRFAHAYGQTIDKLKLETRLNEVCLLEAGALVDMVDFHLRSPRLVTPGPEALQRIFATSGIVSRQTVNDLLGALGTAQQPFHHKYEAANFS